MKFCDYSLLIFTRNHTDSRACTELMTVDHDPLVFLNRVKVRLAMRAAKASCLAIMLNGGSNYEVVKNVRKIE